MSARRIVVGVNGSASSAAAARWAAAEARRRGAALDIVVAHQGGIPGRAFPSRTDLLRTVDERALAIVDAATEQARSGATVVPVRGEAVAGDPVPVLLEAAAGAELLVVGGRGHGDPGPMLGVVTSQAAAYAPCSVAVVRSGDGNDTPDTVVVGLDDSPATSTTAGIAFEQAALRPRRTLQVVSAFTVPPGLDLRGIEAERRRRLSDDLTPWRDKFPDVSVTVDVVSGPAGPVLAQQSWQAGLLVVGAGSDTTFEELRLGPVRLHLLHHAACPVLITRADD
jgi:nucleotide-binding universal stress UspA family protein